MLVRFHHLPVVPMEKVGQSVSGGETGKKNGRNDMALLDDACRCHGCDAAKGEKNASEEVMWKLSNQAFHPAPHRRSLSSGSHCFAHSSLW
jgi:hypothetical protein